MADTTEWDIEKIEQTFRGTGSEKGWDDLTPQDLLAIRTVLDNRSIEEKQQDNEKEEESLQSYLYTIVKDRLDNLKKVSNKDDDEAYEAYLTLIGKFSNEDLVSSLNETDSFKDSFRSMIKNSPDVVRILRKAKDIDGNLLFDAEDIYGFLYSNMTTGQRLDKIEAVLSNSEEVKKIITAEKGKRGEALNAAVQNPMTSTREQSPLTFMTYEQAMGMVQTILDEKDPDAKIGITELQKIYAACQEHWNYDRRRSSDPADYTSYEMRIFPATVGRITRLFNSMAVLDYKELEKYKDLLESVAPNSSIYKQISKLIENKNKLDELKKNKANLEVRLQGIYRGGHPDEDTTEATWETDDYKKWVAENTDDEVINLRNQIAEIDSSIANIEKEQEPLMPSSQQKSAPQQHQEDSKPHVREDSKPPRITAGNVFEHAKKEDLSTWTAEEMRTLLITLNKGQRTFNGVTYDTKALRAKLEKAVVKFSQDFYDNKLVILNMNDAYIWQDVINSCAEHPESEYGKKNVEAVKKAKEKVADQITGFEEEFGLDKKLSQEQIAINLKELEKLPDTSDLFAHKTPDYPVQPATKNFGGIRETVATYRQSGGVPELSVLVGALQNDELGRSDQGPNLKEQLVQWAVERIKLTTELKTPEDIGNFEKLLSLIPLEENEGLIESKRQLVTTAKEAHEQALPLEHPELQEAYNLLNRLEFQGELSTFGRKKLTQEEQKELRNLILQQVEAETRMFLVNTEPTGVSKDRYIQEFNDRLNKHIFHLVAADAINKGNITPQGIQTQLTNVASRKGPITVNHYSFIGWKIAQNNRFGAAVSRLEIDQKTASVGQYFKGKLANLQQNITQHCSQNPLVAGLAGRATGVAQACGWAVLYGVAASNPVALGLVSAASLANTCWSFYKKYRTAKAVAESEGQPLSFWGYVKNHKVDVAMSVCGAVMAITGGAAALSAISQPLAGTMMYMASTSMTALMGIKSYEVAKDTFNKTQGSFWKKSAYALGAAGVVFGTYILTRKAAQGVSGAVQGMDFSGDSAPQDTQLSSVSQDNINNPAYDNEGSGFKYHTSESVWEQSGGEIPDTTPSVPEIDPNNLSQEQQHDIDMLFERAPADANEILGDGDWHGSAKLHNMWENGEISQEKMQALLDHAANTFDDKGHFIDSNGNIDQARENAAVEWQRQHDAATKPSPEPKTFTPNNLLDLEPNLNGLDAKPITSLAPDEVSLPEVLPREGSEITITKMVTDENGNVKIVYRDAEGHRQVLHANAKDINTLGLDKIKFNGDEITVKTEAGGKFTLTNTGTNVDNPNLDSVQSTVNDVHLSVVKEDLASRGLEGAEKVTLHHYNRSEFEVIKGENGWARVGENGAIDSLVKNDDGGYTFQTGSGDRVENMTYEEAKAFAGELQEGWQTSRTEQGLHPNDMRKSLYQSYHEDYAKDISAKLGVSENVKVEYNSETGITTVFSDNGVTITDKEGRTYSAVVKGNIIEFEYGHAMNSGTEDTPINGRYEALRAVAIKDPDSPIAQAFAARDAEIQFQQDLASRGLEGAESIEGYYSWDPSRTTFYNTQEGCALVGEDGKISTLVVDDGKYTFTNGEGKPMSFEEAWEFGQKVSDFQAANETGFIKEFNDTRLCAALYQLDSNAYAENISDQLGIGGKISPEPQQDGSTQVVGENGVSITHKDGLSIAAVKISDGSIEFKVSFLDQDHSTDIENPNHPWLEDLRLLAEKNGKTDIVDAIAAKQAEASQQVGSDVRSEADKATTPTANGNGRAEDSGGKSTQSRTDYMAKLRNGDNPYLRESSDNNLIPKDHLQTSVTPRQVQAMQLRIGQRK